MGTERFHITGKITKRQIEVLCLISKGVSQSKIAICLGISPHTVHNHFASIRDRLDVNSTAQAVAVAIREGLVSMEEQPYLGVTLLFEGLVSELVEQSKLLWLLPQIICSIGMTPIGEPLFQEHPWGPSGYQMMSESHFAYDYFYEEAVAITLFSCKPFPRQPTIDLLIREFHITRHLEPLWIERGVGLKIPPFQSPLHLSSSSPPRL